MLRMQHATILLAGLLAVTLAGCAPSYRDLKPGTVLSTDLQSQSSAVVERQIDVIPSLEPEPAPPNAYLIGSGDLLSITVYGHPELGNSGTLTAPGAIAATTPAAGCRVDETGAIRLPLIGAVQVNGLTVAQAEDVLRAAYLPVIREPWITVVVAEYRSRPLYLFGSFKKPGVAYMDRPMTLLQGIAMAEGIENGAGLRSARLSRNGKVQPVDIYELLANGDQRQNVWLHPGDAIYLPDKSVEQVFIFGAVNKAGQVSMINGQLSLAQAIAASTPLSTGYDFTHVRIIRSLSATRGELLVIDFDRIMRGQAPPFMLANGDIIYLPRTKLGSWNDAMNEILPSLSAISTILQPYVTLKYLIGF